MMFARVLVFALLCALFIACAPATPTLDATMAFFVDDPEVYRRDYYWRGYAKVREWVREAIENYRDRIEIIEMKTDGAKVQGLVRVVSAGTERFYCKTDYLYTFQAIVQNGRLACLNIGQPVSGICGE
jgi:hypothetical protein